MTANPRWNHPLPECTEDNRYTEVLLGDGEATKAERERMARACLACPLYLDCLEDVIAAGMAWELSEVQALIAQRADERTEGPHQPE